MAQKNSITKLILSLFLITILICPYQIYAQDKNIISAATYDTFKSISYYENKNYGYAPGHIIVALKEGHEKALDNLDNFSDIGVTSIKELNKAIKPQADKNDNSQVSNKIALFKINSSDKEDVPATIEKLKRNPNIEYAEPDYYAYLDSTTPNDPYFQYQFGLNRISTPLAWDTTTGSSSIAIGVIDTGIDYNHPDLAGNMWHNPGEIPGNGIDDDGNGYIDDYYGWDFANDDCDPMDDIGHGTCGAGFIAAVGNNGIGVAGTNWTAKLVALKVFYPAGGGYALCPISNVISAINYANVMGISITSNGWDFGPYYSQSMEDTILEGGLFVAAAGNAGENIDTNPCYPASYDCANIIAVACSDPNDDLYRSNYGINSVDLAAPGDGLSCWPNNDYWTAIGTSVSAANVAGAAALLKSYDPNFSTNDLKNMILSRVDKLPQFTDIVASGGRLSFGGKITGQIIMNGQPIENATVIIKDTSENEIASGLTNDNGSYTIPFVPAGNGTVSFTIPINNVVVTSGQTTTVP